MRRSALLAIVCSGAALASSGVAQDGWRATKKFRSPRNEAAQRASRTANIEPAQFATTSHIRRVSWEASLAEVESELAVKSASDPSKQPGNVSESLTIGHLQQLALEHNPTIELARTRTWTSWGQYVQAGLYPNPVVSYTGADIGEEGAAGQQGIQFQQQIVTADKLILGQNVAAESRDLADVIIETQVLRVRNGVRAAFFQVLAAGERLKVTADLVRIANELKVIADAREKGAVGTQLEKLQVQQQLGRAELAHERARMQQTVAWRQLEAVVGLDDLAGRELEGTLHSPAAALTWEAAWSALSEGSPLMRQAERRAARAEAAIELQRARAIPNVTVSVGTQYQFSSDTQLASAQLAVPLPVYNRNQGNITVAETEVVRARREIERLRLQLRQQLATVFGDYQFARTQVDRFEKQLLPDAQSTLDISRRTWKAGQLSYLQVLTAQQRINATKQEYVDALLSLWQAVVRIEGLLLTNGLAAPDSL